MASITVLHPPGDSDRPGEPRTTQAQVSAARTAAVAAGALAQQSWDRFAEALACNDAAEQARRDLLGAIAHHTYAWAVYHCAVEDAAPR